MNRYECAFAPLNREGPLCKLFNSQDLVRRCLDLSTPDNTQKQAAFQELKKLYRDTDQFRENLEYPDGVEQLLHVANSPELRTRISFNEEMVPGFNCIILHQVVYEFLRAEHGDLLEVMEPVMREDKANGKSYINESKVREFLDQHKEELSRFDSELIALYFGSFAFLHEHRDREADILSPLLDWGAPYPELFGAELIS